MDKYTIKEHSIDSSEITKSIRDTQLDESVNTSSHCLLTTFHLYDESHVEIILLFKIEAYPEHLIEKFTFFSNHRFIIIDNSRHFFNQPWDDNAIELFTDIYVAGLNKCNEIFTSKLDSNWYNANIISNNEASQEIASGILELYFSNPKNNQNGEK